MNQEPGHHHLKEKWRLLPEFLKMKGLVSQHLDSFNHFIDIGMKEIVKANHLITSDIDPNFFIEFLDIHVGVPSIEESLIQHDLTPHQCRLRDLTYAAPITIDIRYTRNKQLVIKKDIPIGRMPIMLQSNRCILHQIKQKATQFETQKEKEEYILEEMSQVLECPLDPGGYFIIRGTEKVILMQEQLSKNRIIVDKDKKNLPEATVTSSTLETKSVTKVLMKNDLCIYLKHNSFTEEIPIVIVLKAMGLPSDEEVTQWICAGQSDLLESFSPSLEQSTQLKLFSQNDCLDYISQKMKQKKSTLQKSLTDLTFETLADVVVAHIQPNGLSLLPKAIYISQMSRLLLLALKNDIHFSDRDYVGNKRLELAGGLISLLFEDLFKTFISQIQQLIDKTLQKPQRSEFDAFRFLPLCQSTLTEGLNRAISTGNWTLKRFRMDRAGVTQVLSRLSYISALGMMSRISSQFEKSRKVSGPRALQNSQWGLLCPSDTPEGEACGLVKNLAFMTHVTTQGDDNQLRRILYSLGVEDITLLSGKEVHSEFISSDSGSICRPYLIYLNGVLMGVHRNPQPFINAFKQLRRRNQMNQYTSICTTHHQYSIHIASDSGRICRPLIILTKQQTPLLRDQHLLQLKEKGFDWLLREGLIEYLDCNEENDSLIALNQSLLSSTTNYTHLEIEPYTILGAVAGLIPFPHHNQSPRNTYQCAMGKQSIGTIGYNQFQRFDTLLYLLNYPQQPLVKSKHIEFIHFDRIPSGQNAIVAVMSYSGYDIEDALILNSGSLDRGFGRCMVMKKYSTNIKQYSQQVYDRLICPQPDLNGQIPWRFRLIDRDGLAEVGSQIESGQVYIHKQEPRHKKMDFTQTNTNTSGGEQEYLNTPMTYKSLSPGVIDKICLTKTNEANLLIKVNIRQTRRPELGDKFSSRHGQKGVCGLIVPSVDLPFNDSGIVPDVIMNPHGFPSRMTVGKMLELLAGKAGVLKGELQYGTVFNTNPHTSQDQYLDINQLGQILLENGYHYGGKELLTSGITGCEMDAYTFYGPIYYQKLKHMVMDKLHARSRGPRAILTRQPTEGRSRDGGLRLGEMERDCLIGYGASLLLTERLMKSSDEFMVGVCEGCGLLSDRWCFGCGSGKGVVEMRVPYACKLLFQELQSMGIAPRMTLEEY